LNRRPLSMRDVGIAFAADWHAHRTAKVQR
jgi:hypothetical protein